MKLIIDIPKKALSVLKSDGVDWLGAEHILDAVSKGIPYKERPKGEWIVSGLDYKCSNCGMLPYFRQYNFCPNCGADMRGE